MKGGSSKLAFRQDEVIAEEGGLGLEPPFGREVRDPATTAARERLGDGFDREWEAGRALTQEDALALALGDR